MHTDAHSYYFEDYDAPSTRVVCIFLNEMVYCLVVMRKTALPAECRDVSWVCYS